MEITIIHRTRVILISLMINRIIADVIHIIRVLA